MTVLTPKVFLLRVWPLPISLATTLGISFDFFSSAYLDVSVQQVPSWPPILFSGRYMDFTPCGFPHSEIRGSMAICALPRLIAACHVLLRLPVPRHPPCALSCLTNAGLALCNSFLSCSLCVLNLSLHEFCKTTFVPTICTRQNCYYNFI